MPLLKLNRPEKTALYFCGGRHRIEAVKLASKDLNATVETCTRELEKLSKKGKGKAKDDDDDDSSDEETEDDRDTILARKKEAESHLATIQRWGCIVYNKGNVF